MQSKHELMASALKQAIRNPEPPAQAQAGNRFRVRAR